MFFFKKLFFSLLTVCCPLVAIGANITLQPGDLTTATFAAADKEPLVIDLTASGVYKVSSDLTIPSNVLLKVGLGATIDVAPGKTLTFNGFLEAGTWQVFSGDGHITGRIKVGAIFPQWFGAVGDGVVDDTMPLQKAVDFACESGVLNVELNNGFYRITQTLNCTNTRQPGTIPRDSLKIHGSSFWGTKIIGDTGKDWAIIETSGAQCLELDNFTITDANVKNPSGVGLFTVPPKSCPQSQNQQFHVSIFMIDDMTANKGKGTIGIWNCGSEETTYRSIYVSADRPYILSTHNTGDFFGYRYPHSWLGSDETDVHSNGVTAFIGECYIATANDGTPCVGIYGYPDALHMANVYLSQLANTSKEKCSAAFEIKGSIQSFSYNGTIEGKATFASIEGGALLNANINAVWGIVSEANQALFLLGSDGSIINTDAKLLLADTKNRPLFRMLPSKDSPETCSLVNTTIKTTQDEKWVEIPSKLQSLSKDITIQYSGHPK